MKKNLPLTEDPEVLRSLWLRVVRAAQKEANGEEEAENNPSLIYRARRWLTTASRSFFMVTSLAGLPKAQAEYLQGVEREKHKPV